MKRFLNPKFIIALLAGAGTLIALAVLASDGDDESEHLYGEPDGDVSEGEVSSFVD